MSKRKRIRPRGNAYVQEETHISKRKRICPRGNAYVQEETHMSKRKRICPRGNAYVQEETHMSKRKRICPRGNAYVQEETHMSKGRGAGAIAHGHDARAAVSVRTHLSNAASAVAPLTSARAIRIKRLPCRRATQTEVPTALPMLNAPAASASSRVTPPAPGAPACAAPVTTHRRQRAARGPHRSGSDSAPKLRGARASRRGWMPCCIPVRDPPPPTHTHIPPHTHAHMRARPRKSARTSASARLSRCRAGGRRR